MTDLLLDERPLLVMLKFATLIGLNESIVLQQVHYWLKGKEQRQQDYIDGRYWVYNTYEQWQEQFPFWSIRTLKRIFTTLENSGLLLSANHNKTGFDKTKWYSIDHEALDALFMSYQNGTTMVPTCRYGTCQNDTTNTIDYTKTTKLNVLKGATLKRNITRQQKTPFDKTILEKQMIKSCHKHKIEDCSDHLQIIEYYYSAYMAVFRKEHPRISFAAMDSVIEALRCGSDLVDDTDLETYKTLIEQHFQTQYDNCDYNICHFMTEGICNNRFYETCY